MRRLFFQCIPFVFVALPAFANSHENEDVRKELCSKISEIRQCEEQNDFDRSPPAGAVVNNLKYEYCEKNSCREISKNEIISAEDLPRGASIQFHQKLTVIPKIGKELSWEVEDGYGFQGEMKAFPYEVEFEEKQQYFWVQGSFYERRTNTWISYKTGDPFSFEDEPVISPDGKHLFVHISPVDEYSDPSAIKIYAVTAEKIFEQYRVDRKTSKKISESMIADVKPFWVNSNEIALMYQTEKDGEIIERVVARIVLKNDRWVLVFDGILKK